METRVFRSKVNALIAAIMCGGIAVSLWASFSMLTETAGSARVILGLLLGVGVVLPVWLLVGTRYVVSNDDLKILSGPFRWIIQLAEIRGLSKSSDLISSPALSLDRLRIDYGDGKSVLISPVNESAFVQLLAERNPRLPTDLSDSRKR